MVGELENQKDTVQVLTESAATHVGRIASIVTTAVRDIANEVGEFVTDVFEMREASARSQADARGQDADG